MKTKLKMIYWKGEKFWVGKLLDHPEIMTQGERLKELEENMKDAYRLMTVKVKAVDILDNAINGKTISTKLAQFRG